jgi:hypothetical protein
VNRDVILGDRDTILVAVSPLEVISIGWFFGVSKSAAVLL